MTTVLEHYRAALERLGWEIRELPYETGWKIVGVREHESFVYAGEDRVNLWFHALTIHWDPKQPSTPI
jgi:hypothetical protein